MLSQARINHYLAKATIARINNRQKPTGFINPRAAAAQKALSFGTSTPVQAVRKWSDTL